MLIKNDSKTGDYIDEGDVQFKQKAAIKLEHLQEKTQKILKE